MLSDDKAKLDNAFEFNIDDNLLVARTSGRLVHPSSGRTYHVKFQPPKVAGKDDVISKSIKMNSNFKVTGEALEQRADDKDEVILKKRMEAYHKQTAPVVSYYKKQGILTTIDAAMKPNEVYLQMRNVIKKPEHKQ